MCQVYSTILMIGTEDKAKSLEELPIRLLVIESGKEAVKCLKEEQIDSVVSKWDLVDMPDGDLLGRIIAAKPNMPTIAFVQPGNVQQEIAARSLGVTAILSEDIDDEYFRNTICQLLHVKNVLTVSLCGTV